MTYRVGIEFDDLADSFAAAIGSWVCKHQTREQTQR